MSKKILIQSKLKKYILIVDDEDYEKVLNYMPKLYIQRCKRFQSCYIQVGIRINANNWTSKSLHRIIMNAKQGQQIDHINGNGLDNRKCNLRISTQAENARNKKPNRNAQIKYKGVFWSSKNRFRARIWHNNIKYELGSFISPIDAAKAYDEKAKELFGEFAYLNFKD